MEPKRKPNVSGETQFGIRTASERDMEETDFGHLQLALRRTFDKLNRADPTSG